MPASHEDAPGSRLPLNEIFEPARMHIGGFNLHKNLQQAKTDTSETMSDGILREINKNTSIEGYKVNKKHKFGHGGKKAESNVLNGKERIWTFDFLGGSSV